MRIYCGLQLPSKKANCRAATIVESPERVKPLRQKQRATLKRSLKHTGKRVKAEETRSREQGAGNREQGAGNREQVARGHANCRLGELLKHLPSIPSLKKEGSRQSAIKQGKWPGEHPSELLIFLAGPATTPLPPEAVKKLENAAWGHAAYNDFKGLATGL